MFFWNNTDCYAVAVRVIVCTLLLCGFPVIAAAQFNPEINYQAKLTDTDGMAVANGNYDIVFRLYTASTSGSAIWTESRTGADQVTVTNGLFSVMLGDVTSLASVDFNQTLYLGVTVGADSEMTPRKVLGAVPAAFVAETANELGGVASSSFLRSDQADVMEATSASTLLTITQNGAGNILDLFDGASNVFTVADGGNVGIGSSTPGSRLTVAGDVSITGALRDSSNSAGTSGFVLQTTGSGTQWVATSSLGFAAAGSGISTFLELSDTPSTFTANRILFTNSAGNALTDSPNLTFDGSVLTVGGDILPSANLTYDLGSSTSRFANVWAETLNVGTSTWSIFNGSNGRLAFSNAAEQDGLEALSILSNGNVGVGTTIPTDLFHVAGTSRFEGTLNTSGNWLSGDGDDEGILIDSLGRVGVGTDRPLSNVYIESTVDQHRIDENIPNAGSTNAGFGGDYVAQSFIADVETITKFGANLSFGTETNQIKLAIAPDDGSGNPNEAAVLYAEVIANPVTTGNEWYYQSQVSIAVTPGTKYWVLIDAFTDPAAEGIPTLGQGGTNYTDTNENLIYSTNGGVNWISHNRALPIFVEGTVSSFRTQRALTIGQIGSEYDFQSTPYLAEIMASFNDIGFFGVSKNSAGDVFSIASTTNIGIGITSPTAKLTVAGNTLLTGANRYINFGTATSSIGYGFRDNAGVMEFKNLGGNWDNLNYFSAVKCVGCFDISTAAFDSIALSVSAQSTGPKSMVFNNDGSILYVLNASDIDQDVDAYTLTTPYDISTATFSSIVLSVAAQDTSPTSLLFNNDGTTLYVLGDAGNDINAYTLTTPYDISTATFSNIVLSVAAQEDTLTSMLFNNSGTTLYVMGQSGNDINTYTLTTPYDISTATFSNIVLSVAAQDTSPTSLLFNNDGTTLYVLGDAGNDINAYALSVTNAKTYLSDISSYFGIGTSDPSAQLDVAGTSRFGGTTTFASTLNTSGNWLSGDGDDEGLVIDTKGRIGVGAKAIPSSMYVSALNSTSRIDEYVPNAGAAVSGSLNMAAQSFFADVDTITKIGMWTRFVDLSDGIKLAIVPDDGAGNPNESAPIYEALIPAPNETNLNVPKFFALDDISVSVTIGTKYWVLLDGATAPNAPGGLLVGYTIPGRGGTDTGENGVVSFNAGSTWSSQSYPFSVLIEGIVATQQTQRGLVISGNGTSLDTESPGFLAEIVDVAPNIGYFGVSSSTAGDVFMINSNGNIGIGTTTPGSRLTVAGDSITTGRLLAGSTVDTDGVINLTQAAGLTTDGILALEDTFSDFSFDTVAAIGSVMDINPDANYASSFIDGISNIVQTRAGNGFNLGQISGINTSLAHVGSGTVNDMIGQYIEIFNAGGGTLTNTYGLLIGDITQGTQTNNAYSIYAEDPNAWNYFAGNTGFGTTTPGSRLTVVGNSSLSGEVVVTGNILPGTNLVYDLGSSTRRFSNVWAETVNIGTSTWSIYNGDDGRLAFSNAGEQGGNERFTILDNGNIGIGTTTPQAKFTVAGDISLTANATQTIVALNAGENWMDRNTAAGSATIFLFGAAIGPSGEMLAVGNSGYIRTSTDGGATWTDRNTAAGPGSTALRGAAIGPSGEMLAVGDSGYIRTSTDGGATWINRNAAAGASNFTLRGAAIGPSGEMLAVGDSGYIRTSTDGGVTWIDRSAAAGTGSTILLGAAIGPSGEMLAVGNSGYIRTSTDGGVTWIDRNAAAGASNFTLRGAAIGPSGEMLAVGSSGYIRTSTDGGATWINRNADAGASSVGLNGAAIGPSGEMLAVGNSGYIRTSFPEFEEVSETVPYLTSANGNVGIGTSTPSSRLTVAGTVRFASFGAGTLSTDSAGNLTVSSDERLKDIQEVYVSGIDAIRNIEPISYQWNEASGLEQNNVYVGFSAQNIQANIPSAVGVGANGMLTLSDRPILATLVNATKEQQYVIDHLLGIASSTASSTEGLLALATEDSIWRKLNNLLAGFVDGVLTLAGIRTTEICLTDGSGETCIDRSALQNLIEGGSQSASYTPPPATTEPEPMPTPEPEVITDDTSSTTASSSDVSNETDEMIDETLTDTTDTTETANADDGDVVAEEPTPETNTPSDTEVVEVTDNNDSPEVLE